MNTNIKTIFKIVFFSIFISMSFLAYKSFNHLYKLEYISFQDQINQPCKSNKNILSLCTTPLMIGGLETHTIAFYKNILARNYNAKILLLKDSPLQKEFIKHKLPHYACTSSYKRFAGIMFHPIFSHLKKLCPKHNINIIHTHDAKEVIYTNRIIDPQKIKLIYTRHVPFSFKTERLQNISTAIGVSPQITKYMAEENQNKQLNIKNIIYIPPLLNEKQFSQFKTTESRQNFFKNNFNINVNNTPIFTMIANMHPDLRTKNHQLLFHAVRKLIYEKKKLIQVVLAGTGQGVPILKELAKQLNIEKYVHFIGHTNKITELLYHSNVKILTSTHEAFGIVLLEAAFMKKPIIGSSHTGMTNVIKHCKTGLLFKNNDLESLVKQMETVIDKPRYAKQLGENAYKFVLENFSSNAVMEKFENLYEQL